MEKLVFNSEFNNYSDIEKRQYIKQLISNYDLNNVIIELVKNNDIVDNFNLLNYICRIKEYKEKNKLTNLELTSLMINNYILLNKTKELNSYIKTLDDKNIKKMIKYEIDNQTEFSKLKRCKELEKK